MKEKTLKQKYVFKLLTGSVYIYIYIFFVCVQNCSVYIFLISSWVIVNAALLLSLL